MSIDLGISTSLSQFKVVLGSGGELLYRSDNIAFDYSMDLTQDIANGLKEIGKSKADLGLILVDIGPGGTSSVRTGVAIANALGYSLGIPVAGVSSMELIGIEAYEKHNLPILSLVKSIRNNAYFGLYEPGKFNIEYGQFDDLAEKVCSQYSKIVLAGAQREKMLEKYAGQCIDSGLSFVNADILVSQREQFKSRAGLYPKYPDPITEQNLVK